jgi:DNA-directed RNA polymerase specialized sigma24 family protein
MNAILEGLNQTGLICVLCLFILLCIILSGFCLLLYFQSQNSLKELRIKLDTLEQQVQSREYSKAVLDNTSNKQLDKDELKSRLENITANKSEVPDKYRHVVQLEQSGLEVEEIADILDISQNEAGQILSLARLSNAVQ